MTPTIAAPVPLGPAPSAPAAGSPETGSTAVQGRDASPEAALFAALLGSAVESTPQDGVAPEEEALQDQVLTQAEAMALLTGGAAAVETPPHLRLRLAMPREARAEQDPSVGAAALATAAQLDTTEGAAAMTAGGAAPASPPAAAGGTPAMDVVGTDTAQGQVVDPTAATAAGAVPAASVEAADADPAAPGSDTTGSNTTGSNTTRTDSTTSTTATDPAAIDTTATDPAATGDARPVADDGAPATTLDTASTAATEDPGQAAPPGLTAPVEPNTGHTRSAGPAAPSAGPPAPLDPGPPTSQLASAVAALRRRGDGEYVATLDLHPAELGRVRVEVEVRAGQVNVQVSAEHAGTRSLLQTGLDDLRAALQQGGLDAGQLDVSQQGWGGPEQDPGTPSGHDGPTGTATEEAADPVVRPVTVPLTTIDAGLDVRL